MVQAGSERQSGQIGILQVRIKFVPGCSCTVNGIYKMNRIAGFQDKHDNIIKTLPCLPKLIFSFYDYMKTTEGCSGFSSTPSNLCI